MDSRLPLPSSEYWYLGSPNPAMDELFRRLCVLAWPYALYCATRYLHDIHAAYDLMDAAVSNTERYYERFQGERTLHPALLQNRECPEKALQTTGPEQSRNILWVHLRSRDPGNCTFLTIRSGSDGVH